MPNFTNSRHPGVLYWNISETFRPPSSTFTLTNPEMSCKSTSLDRGSYSIIVLKLLCKKKRKLNKKKQYIEHYAKVYNQFELFVVILNLIWIRCYKLILHLKTKKLFFAVFKVRNLKCFILRITIQENINPDLEGFMERVQFDLQVYCWPTENHPRSSGEFFCLFILAKKKLNSIFSSRFCY